MRTYTRSEQMMIEDGAPECCFISQDQRAASWTENPPRPMIAADPRWDRSRELAAEQKRRKTARRMRRLAATIDPETGKKYDLRGKQWNMRLCRWEDAT